MSQRLFKLGRQTVALLGSSHDSRDVLRKVEQFEPSIICLELCRERRVSFNRSISRKSSLDVGSLVDFAHKNSVRTISIDRSIFETANQIYTKVESAGFKSELVHYAMVHRAAETMGSLALYLELFAAHKNVIKMPSLTSFCDKWLFENHKYQKAFDLSRSKSFSEAVEFISIYSNHQGDPDRFTQGPRGYERLCQLYGLNEILNDVIIKERDVLMAENVIRIAGLSESESRNDRIAVVVGSNHIDGMADILNESSSFENTIGFEESSFSPTLSDWWRYRVIKLLLE